MIINVTGAANINRTVIQGYLSTSNVIVNNTNGSITVAADIMSTTNSDLTLKAVGNIFQNANVTVSTDGGDIIFGQIAIIMDLELSNLKMQEPMVEVCLQMVVIL